MAKLFEHFGKAAFTSGLLLTCLGGTADYYMQRRAQKKLVWALDNALEEGTRPASFKTHGAVRVERPSVVSDIHTRLIAASGNFFGVIYGPAGAGKTDVTREACRFHPKGVLYLEVYEPRDLARELAKTAHIPLDEHAHLLDYIVHRAGIKRYSACYRLPRDLQHEGVSQVLDILAERGVRFREKHGHIPCLFIDGVDLLSKENPTAFVALVDKAKALASNGSLRLVFVAGDGDALSLIEQTPSASKQDVPVHVRDISDDEADYYLVRSGLSAPLSKQIVQLTGGRFAHLEKALWVCNGASAADDATLHGAVRRALRADAERALLRARVVNTSSDYELKKEILRCVLTAPPGGIKESELLERICRRWPYGSAAAAVGELVKHSVLRSGDHNVLLAHSRLCETHVRETLKLCTGWI